MGIMDELGARRLMKMERCTTVLTHSQPHFDEAVAYFIARWFGEEHFLGIRRAPVRFVSTGHKHEKSWEEYWDEGVLCIGTGGGPFDEHAKRDRKRVRGECAATLIAIFLWLASRDEAAIEKAKPTDGRWSGKLWVETHETSDKALEQILRWVVENDLAGTSHQGDIASTMKDMFLAGDSDENVLFWAMDGILARYHGQELFWRAIAELKANGLRETIEVGSEKISLLSIVTENPKMAVAARSEHGVGADLIVQKSPKTGQVQIFLSRRLDKTRMNGVAELIREREAELRGIALPDNTNLSVEGEAWDGDPWYFVHGMMLNGSNTNNTAEPTKIEFEEIVELVKLGIS